MKFLKQGLCLALLGAGLSAAPVSWPSAAATPSSQLAAAAHDQACADSADDASGTVTVSSPLGHR